MLSWLSRTGALEIWGLAVQTRFKIWAIWSMPFTWQFQVDDCNAVTHVACALAAGRAAVSRPAADHVSPKQHRPAAHGAAACHSIWRGGTSCGLAAPLSPSPPHGRCTATPAAVASAGRGIYLPAPGASFCINNMYFQHMQRFVPVPFCSLECICGVETSRCLAQSGCLSSSHVHVSGSGGAARAAHYGKARVSLEQSGARVPSCVPPVPPQVSGEAAASLELSELTAVGPLDGCDLKLLSLNGRTS